MVLEAVCAHNSTTLTTEVRQYIPPSARAECRQPTEVECKLAETMACPQAAAPGANARPRTMHLGKNLPTTLPCPDLGERAKDTLSPWLPHTGLPLPCRTALPNKKPIKPRLHKDTTREKASVLQRATGCSLSKLAGDHTVRTTAKFSYQRIRVGHPSNLERLQRRHAARVHPSLGSTRKTQGKVGGGGT